MKSHFRQVALIGKYQSATSGSPATGARAALEEIARFLVSEGCAVVLEQATAANTGITEYPTLDATAIGEQCDLGLVVGGDGTMLGIGRQLARHGVPLIGINQGRLGFITDIPLDSFRATLTPMLRGEFEEDQRSLMQAQVMRDGECVFDALAMNDVVVNRGATSGMVELRVEVDGHFVSNQRADGLIVASPTGSTAYALSAGGPLLHPSISGFVLVPIAPHTLSNRPIVLADASVISIAVVAGRDASANFDMQSLASLLHGDRIVVRRSQHRVRFLHPKGWTYFDTLRGKLHWNEGG
jgi:NAD+ kinase